MLKAIESFYDMGGKAVKASIPISVIMNKELMEKLYKMKYNVPNDKPELIDDLESELANYFEGLVEKYR